MAGGKYLRYIVFAISCLALLFFISSSSNPGGVRNRIPPALDSLKDKFGQHKDDGGLGGHIDHDYHPEQEPTSTSVLLDAPTPTIDVDEANHILHGKPKGAHREEDGSEKDSAPSRSKQKKLKGPKGAPAEGQMNATFVTLARNRDVWDIIKSIRQVEDRFNRNYNYDWVFLNDQPFDETFKTMTSKIVSGKAKYGVIPEEHWSFPEWIDQDKAAEVRKKMSEEKVIYGDSISYRHMCRFESGFFFRHPLLLDYEWYWRVEPGIDFFCDIPYDTFKFMADHNKSYSFVLSLKEYPKTIPTLWDSVKEFIREHPEHIAEDNSMKFLSNDGGSSYNLCHFWSNFEIGNLDWLRSKAYMDFFEKLDNDGGFFYERWGDAPVHSIAAGLLLQKDQIHFFRDIGYYHVPFTHCPTDDDLKDRAGGKCHCNPHENFDWNGYSCTAKFYDLHGREHPKPT